MRRPIFYTALPVTLSVDPSTPHSLRFNFISKSFPGVRALQEVGFDVAGGKVHALLGENGAGKSTLLKILAGAYQPDAGGLVLDGKNLVFHSPSQAIGAGVAVIYQELHLVPELSVAENLFIGHLPAAFGWVKRGDLFQKTRGALAALGEEINPRTKVRDLPIAQQQMIEIAKALGRGARVLAFDEPTSSLSSREVDRLFAIIRKLRDERRVVLYVTHRMEEVFHLCDAATVLRDGKHVETFPSLAGVTSDELVHRMVGRAISDIFHYAPRKHGESALEVEKLIGPGLKSPASFSVARGEILGIFGLVGAGRTELLKLIYGAQRARRGKVMVLGETIRMRSERDAIAAGIVLCPEDRKKEGIIPIRSVMDNINLGVRRHFSPMGFINSRRERTNARQFIDRLGVKAPSLGQLMVNLSGGNQQKAILGRWLGEKVRVMLLDEPTRGIDVGAKSEIYSIIYDQASRGIGVVVVSSELPELLGICDRVLVMRQGAIVADMLRKKATAQAVLQAALPANSAASVEARIG
jgi:L-arabinose transport system ATP-binding protein